MQSGHLRIDELKLQDLCRRWRIARLAFFGSVLRDDFRPDSDVDVLIEFEPGHVPGLDVFDLEEELSALCGGRRVDLVNPRYLNRWFRDDVLGTAELVYAQA